MNSGNDQIVEPAKPVPTGRWLEVFAVFLRLGLTSFGGPVAHLGYFRDEFVVRRRWLSDRAYADLVALCQFLPGPASSQVGLAIGLSRAGYPGALAAWTGFTLPSAIALVLFAYGVSALGDVSGAGWLHGLKVVAVAVVAQAVLGMMRSLTPDRERATMAVIAAAIVLAVPSAWGQIGAIILGALAGITLLRAEAPSDQASLPLSVSQRTGFIMLGVFFVLLIGLPLLASVVPTQSVKLFDSFYRAGSLVFGGGHVVLPLLQASVVPPGWVTNDAFLAGYGAAQAVPGPLFTFAAFLGASMGPEPNGWMGAAICLVAVFLPSFLLVVGALPFWEGLRHRPTAQAALRGVNAAVVGLLLAALYNPVWTAGILNTGDFALAAAAFLLLVMWQVPPWLVVVLSAAGGAALAMV
ncbi:chromate efflux transporter [Bradyrhizobium sp. LHD-71]|uniref:chromate efflux transporter n=1 Tax=Bradyrhizobium sp. LHD-71 TaxID=3072141 RepID=UPI0035BE467C